MSVTQRIRNIMGVIHRWTGLAIAVFLIIVGLTGTLLAFRGHIDALFNPGMHVKHAPGQKELSLAELAERAEADLPHARLGFFAVEADQVIFHLVARTNPATGKPYTDTELHVAFNPYTGERLHCGLASDPNRPCRDVMGFIYDLHTSVTTRTDWGWRFVGAVALLWTIDCFVAFFLTLPRGTGPFWKRWRQAWQVKWGANSTRVHFDLHRAGGLWLWPLLFVFAWSSVMLGLREVYDPVMATVFDFANDSDFMAKNVIPKPLENPKLNWREVEATGAKMMSEAAAAHHFTIERPYGMAYIPEYGAYTYGVRSSLDLRGHGWDTTVLIDGNTGQLRELDLPRGQHLGNTISTLLWGIHYGDLRDWLPYRVLVGGFGIFLAVLSYTGVVIWWRKQKAKKMSVRSKLSATIVLLLSFCAASAHAQATAAQSIRIRFAGRLGGKPFACGEKYTGIGNKPATVTPADLRFFVSSVTLLDAAGNATPIKLDQDGVWQYQDLALVDLEDGTGGCRNGNAAMHTEVTGTVPSGTYTGLRFTVGVPLALDHIDPVSAPAPLNFTAMNWVWQVGFKFIRAEVLVVPDRTTQAATSTPPVQDNPMSTSSPKGGKLASMRSNGVPVHVGSTGCASSALTAPPIQECSNPNRIAVTLPAFNVTTDVVIFDMDMLLAGSDVTTNTPETPPGCMSGEDDADCIPIFKALGLPFRGSAPSEQTVFYSEAMQ
jgi:uncharacterized repeat protein (TIGR04052 family)